MLAITAPPSVPHAHHTAISPHGGAEVSPAILPEATYSAAIHTSLTNIITAATVSFAAYTADLRAGTERSLFHPCSRCSIYIV